MRLLTLVRHAKSSWDYPELSDFERPLNERGRRDAARMASRAGHALPRASRLLTSPATRAITTARIFAEALGIDFDAVQVEPRIYQASRKTLLDVLQSIADSAQHIVIFGHNPGLSELAHTLASCPFDEMPTAAVVHFQLAVKHWREVGPGCGKLSKNLFPKDGLD